MPEHGSLKIGRRRLATELRRLRELASLTGEEVADQLGWSGSKISRIELNRTEVKSTDLIKLLDLYGVGGTQRTDLVALVQAPRNRGWWEAYSDAVDAEYATYIALESEAEAADCWSPQLAHGLLQTGDYARAVIEAHLAWMPTTPPAKVRRLVEVRLARQRVLSNQQLLSLSVVLDESVLLRQIGDRPVMRTQLEHLVRVSRLPNVTVRVLPLKGAHPLATGSFTLLAFPPILGIGPPSAVLYIEDLTRNHLYADEEADADAQNTHRRAFDGLVSESLDPDQSRERIATVASQNWG